MPPKIVLGIRPENVHIASDEDRYTIQGQVFLVENLGMHNLISVRVKISQTDWITLRALLPTDQQWSGETVTLALPPQSLHWFDVETGDRLFF